MKEDHHLNYGFHPYHPHHPQHHELYGHHHASAGADDPLDVLDDLDELDVAGLNSGYLQVLVQILIISGKLLLRKTTLDALLTDVAEFSAQENARDALTSQPPTSPNSFWADRSSFSELQDNAPASEARPL